MKKIIRERLEEENAKLRAELAALRLPPVYVEPKPSPVVTKTAAKKKGKK